MIISFLSFQRFWLTRVEKSAWRLGSTRVENDPLALLSNSSLLFSFIIVYSLIEWESVQVTDCVMLYIVYIVLVVSFVAIATWALLEKALGSSTWIFTCSSPPFKLRPLLRIFALMAYRSSQIWASFKLWDVYRRNSTIKRSLLVEKDFIHIRVTALTLIISK